MTAETPGSSGSSRIIRDSTPSVTTRMRVLAETAVFHAHGITDRAAGLLAEQRGHASGGGAGGEPARLEQHDAAVAQPALIKQRQRHERRLAGARRRHQHGTVAAA